jgi:hypothetical protein
VQGGFLVICLISPPRASTFHPLWPFRTRPAPASSAHPHGLTCGVRVLTVFPSPPRGENEEEAWSPSDSTSSDLRKRASEWNSVRTIRPPWTAFAQIKRRAPRSAWTATRPHVLNGVLMKRTRAARLPGPQEGPARAGARDRGAPGREGELTPPAAAVATTPTKRAAVKSQAPISESEDT